MAAVLIWFRTDLRLRDNPAVAAAAKRNVPILPVYIWSPGDDGEWAPGGASRWWLHHSLQQFSNALKQAGSKLIVLNGDSTVVLPDLVRRTRAEAVFWNRRYEPEADRTDALVESRLRDTGTQVEIFNGNLLFDPDEVLNRQGKPFRVFTPFWRACTARGEPSRPWPGPRRLMAPPRWPRSVPLKQLELLPRTDWTDGIRRTWKPGESGAHANLKRFLKTGWEHYEPHRDRPDLEGTSRLSPHLHWGEIGPRQLWHSLVERAGRSGRARSQTEAWLRQLIWREFAHYLLHHFPHTPDEPLYDRFRRFPWSRDRRGMQLWCRGQTGYPLVDAGMRQLWQTGWMHNRVRMVVASLLVKHLLIDWREGARWFWDTLVDADLANNTLGWQWCAGCGADAAPYFRIFNPTTQGERFDPDGEYVRRWVPELSALPARWIHSPWAAPASILSDAGVRLNHTYPAPIVDHAVARKRALAAYARFRKAAN